MLHRTKLATLVASAMLMFSTDCFAGYAFTPSLSFAPKQNTVKGSNVQSSANAVDLRLGYVFDSGLYVGGLYTLSDEEPSQPSTPGSASYSVGPSVGFSKWNAFAFLTYILAGERDLNSGGIKYSGATGVHFDVGYIFQITERFSLGPQLGYRKLSYRNLEFDGRKRDGESLAWDIVSPAIVGWFSF